MKSAETVAMEKRVDRLETIVKCMGNATEIASLLNRLDALSAKCESLEKRVAYYKSEAAGGLREAHRDRDELYTKLRGVYDRICGALTVYECEDETLYHGDKGLAMYGDILEIHGMMAEWGL